MVSYLECLKELNDYLISKSNVLPKSNDFIYKINYDSINNFSIKYDQNYPENWSQCMKYLLTILKFYISIILKKEHDEINEILDKSMIINNK